MATLHIMKIEDCTFDRLDTIVGPKHIDRTYQSLILVTFGLIL